MNAQLAHDHLFVSTVLSTKRLTSIRRAYSLSVLCRNSFSAFLVRPCPQRFIGTTRGRLRAVWS